MINRSLLSVPICCLFLILGNKAYSQADSDTSYHEKAFKKAINVYNSSLNSQSPLYNGPEYYFYGHGIKGNAYFQDNNSFVSGAVFYQGTLYTEVPLMYDLNSQKVIVQLYDHASNFSLLNEYVQSFDLLGSHFIRIDADTLAARKPVLKTGYYAQLNKGKMLLLVKYSKKLEVAPLTAERYFTAETDFFLKKEQTYYPIDNMNALLAVLKDKKAELQKYIKQNKIYFKDTPEDAILKVLTHYDSLTR